jgi:hypothetical protein
LENKKIEIPGPPKNDKFVLNKLIFPNLFTLLVKLPKKTKMTIFKINQKHNKEIQRYSFKLFGIESKNNGINMKKTTTHLDNKISTFEC